MPALSFKARFCDAIVTGTKKQTIRNLRKRPFQVSDPLYLYYAQRSPLRKFLKEVVCTEVCRIEIRSQSITLWNYTHPFCGLVKKIKLVNQSLDEFAKADGFEDWADMKAFWIAEHGKRFGSPFPFTGQLIRW